jgi:hypothetical protein
MVAETAVQTKLYPNQNEEIAKSLLKKNIKFSVGTVAFLIKVPSLPLELLEVVGVSVGLSNTSNSNSSEIICSTQSTSVDQSRSFVVLIAVKLRSQNVKSGGSGC